MGQCMGLMIEHYGIIIGPRNYISRPSPVDAKLPHIGDGMRPCRRSGRRGQSLDRASVSDVVDSRWYSDPTLLEATDVGACIIHHLETWMRPCPKEFALGKACDYLSSLTTASARLGRRQLDNAPIINRQEKALSQDEETESGTDTRAEQEMKWR